MPEDQAAPEVIIQSPELPGADAEKPKKWSKKRSKDSPKQRKWERIKSWGKTAVQIFANIPAAVIAALLLVSLLILIFHRHSLDLDAIGVPETPRKAGFTSKVATEHLRDAIYAVEQRAQTNMALRRYRLGVVGDHYPKDRLVIAKRGRRSA